MIRYIKGILIGKEEGRIVVLAGGVGYEILLPEIVWLTFQTKQVDEEKEEPEDKEKDLVVEDEDAETFCEVCGKTD